MCVSDSGVLIIFCLYITREALQSCSSSSGDSPASISRRTTISRISTTDHPAAAAHHQISHRFIFCKFGKVEYFNFCGFWELLLWELLLWELLLWELLLWELLLWGLLLWEPFSMVVLLKKQSLIMQVVLKFRKLWPLQPFNSLI